ncbi:MAG: hypothetical protein GXP27_14795 [Planctomycetes bacterium]|nr:hypothetical protein [Planctomycetota bacterium]
MNSLADSVAADGKVTLREAVQAANTNTAVGDAVAGAVDGDRIVFDSAVFGGTGATITLDVSLQDIRITDDLEIDGLTGSGGGATKVTLSGGGHSRIFLIDSAGGPGTSQTVRLFGLTFTDGDGTGNTSASDGAGGALLIYYASPVTLDRVTVTGNTASASGGGIWNTGTLTVVNSTVSNNSAGDAGGLYNAGDGTATITSSTFSGNSATDASSIGGGAIVNSGTAALTNSTLSGNTSAANGGGLYARSGTSTLDSCTITDNTAQYGGGIGQDVGVINILNTIVAENTATSVYPDVFATVTSGGYNLVGDGTGAAGFTGTADQVGTAASPIDPKLGALQLNGGFTATHALQAGSPAADVGGGTQTVDQRGQPRPSGQGRDIGAYEAQTRPTVNGTAGNDRIVVQPRASDPTQIEVVRNGQMVFAETAAFIQSLTVNGLAGDDTLIGSALAETLSGGPGNDTIHALGGDDSVTGDDGDDYLRGYSGNDSLDGGVGNDRLLGTDGNDDRRRRRRHIARTNRCRQPVRRGWE